MLPQLWTLELSREALVPGLLVDPRRPIVTDSMTIAAGAGPLPRGTVLDMVASTGKAVPAVPTATDGSAQPAGVLVEAFDASTADVQGSVYVAAELDSRALVYDTTWSRGDLVLAMRRVGLHVRVMASAV